MAAHFILLPPQERLPAVLFRRLNYRHPHFLIRVSAKKFRRHSSRSIAPPFCHLRIDSLPHSATHIGSAQSGMVQWEFVITIKRRLAIAPTLSVLSFASIARL
jgi:hypothetical protein